jgi:molecular chaperone HtpG
MQETQETHRFQAETQELLSLVIHSLYKHREIFLRELVSNASDAIDKRRFESLTRPAIGGVEAAAIRISTDRAARTLTVEDDGIGMNHDELLSHLGTIARSGTRAFLAKIKAAGETAPELIGQFGVGFYASFMIADLVVVETRRAGESAAWRWRSDGKGEYSIEPCTKDTDGTRVTLHLRAKGEDEDEDPADFLDEMTIREVVKRYSDFVAYPIQLEVEGEKDDAPKTWETINSQRPLWSRPKDDIQREEYDEFYRHLSHDWTAPRQVIHFRAEGTLEYTALLFVPGRRPMDIYDGSQGKSRLSLYVKRVLIMQECPDLLPTWLRFVRGLVDSPDLPLNVSRDVLQASTAVRAIQKRLVKRIVETLAQMLESEREEYRKFWADFGTLIKEGIYAGDDEEKRLSKLLLFETTQGEAPATLAEYVARCPKEQTTIWYLAGSDRKALEGSPHVEAFKKRGIEVLFFTDPIDEWLLQRLSEFDGKPLKPIDRGALEIEGEGEKEAREKLDRDHRDLLAAIEVQLTNDVKSVRFTTRLADSPAVLVNDEHALSANMERILRAANQEVKREKRILELNPDHPWTRKLEALHAADPRSGRLNEMIELLYGQALLAEGSPLPDAARFAKLVSKFVVEM